MSKDICRKKMLLDIVDNKSLNVVDGCIPSLKTTIEVSDISQQTRDEMLKIIALIEKHYRPISFFVGESIKNIKNQ